MKPNPTITRKPPAPLLGKMTEAMQKMRDLQETAYLKQVHEALMAYINYWAPAREFTISDVDGDGYVILGKDLREEPVGQCPFILSAVRKNNEWKCELAPGVVLFEHDSLAIEAFEPEYAGAPLSTDPRPELILAKDDSVWFVHNRTDGLLTSVTVTVSAAQPAGDSVVKIATLKSEDTPIGPRWYIDQVVAGSYVLRPPCDSGSGGGGSSSSSSSSFSKTAIIPMKGPSGMEYVGFAAVEANYAWLDHVAQCSAGRTLFPTEFYHACKPNSIRIASIYPYCDAKLERLGGVISIVLPRASTVTLCGISKLSPKEFPRYSEKSYRKNLAFYAQAHQE